MVKVGRYSITERLRLDELYNIFLGLAPQQQTLALIGIGILLMLLIALPVTCASSSLGKMEKQIADYEKNVTQVTAKISEYNGTQEKLKVLERKIRPKSQVQLTTRLESLATQNGIGGNIDSLKENPGTPGEDYEQIVVAVNMSRLSLLQIMEFLYGIETQQDLSLTISRMQLKPRYDNRSLFDANFEVSTFVSAQQSE